MQETAPATTGVAALKAAASGNPLLANVPNKVRRPIAPPRRNAARVFFPRGVGRSPTRCL